MVNKGEKLFIHSDVSFSTVGKSNVINIIGHGMAYLVKCYSVLREFDIIYIYLLIYPLIMFKMLLTNIGMYIFFNNLLPMLGVM